MKTPSEMILKVPIVSLNIGPSGAGKTHFACTYPRCYVLITEPNSEQTWFNKPELRKNIVAYEHFIPDNENLKDMFNLLTKEIQNAKTMQAKGEVDTIILDNLTYLIHNRWLWINKYGVKKTSRGDVDTRGMYGSLRDWCYMFLVTEMLTFKGNIVVTAHEMLENDEALEKKVDKSILNVPNIIGGFRNDIDGLFSNVFYLDKLVRKEGGYRYVCRTNKGNGKNAKNRLGLPEVIENISYATLKETMDKAMKGETK